MTLMFNPVWETEKVRSSISLCIRFNYAFICLIEDDSFSGVSF